MEKQMFEVSDNRIVLLNGEELTCFPKKQSNVNETTSFDADANRRLFLKNAFLFFRNAHRIFSDSRMFLAPVPIENGLSISGKCRSTPTLGIYLEWWLNCEVDTTKDKEGNDALTYRWGGSPLSGANCCGIVYPDGRVKSMSFNRFHTVFYSFLEISRRYTEAKKKFEAYSLQQVVDTLSNEEIEL
ncbi:MAG: hypothetical protein MJZ33_06305 [Paludibacteraceae bacterium]|nr:hypothetical protein [Paludibacteraceae bacterium]